MINVGLTLAEVVQTLEVINPVVTRLHKRMAPLPAFAHQRSGRDRGPQPLDKYELHGL